MNLHPIFEQLLSPFMSPQKTAKQIQEIDLSDRKIWVEDWSLDYAWFKVAIYRNTWPSDMVCFTKEFFPWEFEEYLQEEYNAPAKTEEWFKSKSIQEQRPYVEGFVRIHDAILQAELDNYYNKHK